MVWNLFSNTPERCSWRSSSSSLSFISQPNIQPCGATFSPPLRVRSHYLIAKPNRPVSGDNYLLCLVLDITNHIFSVHDCKYKNTVYIACWATPESYLSFWQMSSHFFPLRFEPESLRTAAWEAGCRDGDYLFLSHERLILKLSTFTLHSN